MIYLFGCTNEKCDFEEEKMMKLAEYEETKDSFTCPRCDSSMTPQVTIPHFRLIGGAWARDGYSNYIRNDQKKELNEYDKHQRDHDTLIRKEERLGEF